VRGYFRGLGTVIGKYCTQVSPASPAVPPAGRSGSGMDEALAWLLPGRRRPARQPNRPPGPPQAAEDRPCLTRPARPADPAAGTTATGWSRLAHAPREPRATPQATQGPCAPAVQRTPDSGRLFGSRCIKAFPNAWLPAGGHLRNAPRVTPATQASALGAPRPKRLRGWHVTRLIVRTSHKSCWACLLRGAQAPRWRMPPGPGPSRSPSSGPSAEQTSRAASGGGRSGQD